MKSYRKRNREYRKNPTVHVIMHADYSVVCPYCLKEFNNPDDITIDHILPLSRFNKSDTVLCCKRCNHEKGALTASEYAIWKNLEAIRNGRVK